MLIYDRRRCRPPEPNEVRERMTIPQRARLGELASQGWSLIFVRGEGAGAFVSHEQHGFGVITRRGRLVRIRDIGMRTEPRRESTQDAQRTAGMPAARSFDAIRGEVEPPAAPTPLRAVSAV